MYCIPVLILLLFSCIYRCFFRKAEMRSNICKKLGSEKGASILFALLLFLVCAVIGAIVLTAATAAAGRAAKLAESDQRYHSVASAAELISHELSGQPVTIVREHKQVTTKTQRYIYEMVGGNSVNTPDGAPSTSTTDTYTTTVGSGAAITGSNQAIDTSTMSMLSAEAVRLLFKGNSCNNDAAMNYVFGGSGTLGTSTLFTLEHTTSATGVSGGALKINGSIDIASDGSMTVTLTNAEGSDKFSVAITLLPAFENHEYTDKNDSQSVATAADGKSYTETVTTTNTIRKVSTVTWTVSSIR